MNNPLKSIPSVDRLLSSNEIQNTLAQYGHSQTTVVIRQVLDSIRQELKGENTPGVPSLASLALRVDELLAARSSSSLTPVYNLTGTVLHTNLGRAQLPPSALEAVTTVASGASNLEFDLSTGKRGDRDAHLESILLELTGAEAVTVVNNNAAAVLICLNTFAFGKGVCISRGELVEIGGSFRIPEVMEKSGCRLIELGATNRTHLRDYERAISDNTGLLMKVHTSNYEIRGFTQEVSYAEIAKLASERAIPFLADLGSGTLVNLEDHGLEHEPTVQEVLSAGTDIVTFSGDKLLGGPQAGIIAGKKELVEQVKQNPLKRALRVDKMTLAALTEVLKLYRQPETLAEELPTLRHLARKPAEMQPVGEALLPILHKTLDGKANVKLVDSSSQIGSGALPLDQLASLAIEITPVTPGDGALQKLTRAFRDLPVPVIGRLQDGRLLFDLRTVDDPSALAEQISALVL